MGVSFTFVTVLSTISANYGYPAVVGAVLAGGLFEGTLGLMAKYWRKIITPIVAASVVTAIGFSLFTVGARSFGGGYNDDFGSASEPDPWNRNTGYLSVCGIFLQRDI
ncbi:MAG: solute carrier family 23 protein [Clostridium sp.]